MLKAPWDHQREALARLTRALVEERSGGLMGEALDHLLYVTGWTAGAAFAASPTSAEAELELVSERRLSEPHYLDAPPSDGTRRVLLAVAMRAARKRTIFAVPDLRLDEETGPLGAEELSSRGLRAAIAAPVVHRRRTLGVLVLLARDTANVDSDTLTTLRIGTRIVALAAERDRRADRELSHRSELAEAARMASLGLVTATVAQELRTPFDALLVQLEEQMRLLPRLAAAARDREAVREMAELLGETRAATAQIGAFLAQLSNMSQPRGTVERFELRDIVQEAVALVGIELQRRSIRLTEHYAVGCVTSGDRSSLIQVVINLVFYAAEACTAAGGEPTIILRVWPDDSRVVLSVEDTGAKSGTARSRTSSSPSRRTSAAASIPALPCACVVTS